MQAGGGRVKCPLDFSTLFSTTSTTVRKGTPPKRGPLLRHTIRTSPPIVKISRHGSPHKYLGLDHCFRRSRAYVILRDSTSFHVNLLPTHAIPR